ELIGGLRAEELAYGGIVGAEPFAHAFEREREGELLELRIDRGFRGELLLDARERGVAIFTQAIVALLRQLGGAAQERARIAEQAAVEAGAGLEIRVRQIERAARVFGLLDRGPRVAGAGGEIGTRGHFGFDRRLFLRFALEQLIHVERVELLAPDFQRVFE